MKYNIDNIDVNNGFTLFYGHSIDSPFALLSQFAVAPFEYNGISFRTAEHYMMFSKAILFLDDDIAKEILKTESPYRVKKLGRKVKGFSQKIWDERNYSIILHGNLLKFSQNAKAREVLLSTNDTIIVECSPTDKIYGIGLNMVHVDTTDPKKWKGTNLLGFALMEVRDIIEEHLNENK